jgi:reverse transcriptase-like protein
LYIKEWKNLTDDEFVLQAIKNFKIPFIRTPLQRKIPNEFKFSNVERDVARLAILELIKSGSVFKIEPKPDQFISRIFLVPKKEPGKYRLVINLKYLNNYVDSPHFKMEDYRTVLNLMRKDMYMATIDLRDAYHSIPIHPKHQKYLCFEFEKQRYHFTCVPFGLSCAPRLFTKLMRPIMAQLRNIGFTSNQYLDDILAMEMSSEKCSSNVVATCELLQKLGFRIHEGKSQLIPSQIQTYLGFLYNSVEMTISLPMEKRQKVLKVIHKFLSKTKPKIRDAANMIGNLVAASPAIAFSGCHVKRLEMEKTEALLLCEGDFDEHVTFSKEALDELNWWKLRLPLSYNLIRNDTFDYVLTTDASKTGWGALVDNEITRGFWSVTEQKLHINVQELIAIFYGLKSFFSDNFDCSIIIKSDSTTAISYINRFGGCRSPDNFKIAYDIWNWGEAHNIWLFATYISSSDNFLADRASREQVDENDFCLDNHTFDLIIKEFGMPVIDLFASMHSHKCTRYISWFPDPKSEAVDAFTVPWTDFFYAFPPFCVIARVLRKIENENSRGILIVPDWKAQNWFPIFIRLCEQPPLKLMAGSFTLFSPYDNSVHDLSRNLNLLAGIINGKTNR